MANAPTRSLLVGAFGETPQPSRPRRVDAQASATTSSLISIVTSGCGR